MFDQLKNLAGLMSQAGQIKERMEQMHAELERRTVTADAGAGAVRVTMNGRFEAVAVELDPVMVKTLAGDGDQTDRRMVEDLIVAAFNAAHAKATDMAREEMQKMAGGMDLPGLDHLLPR